MNRPRLSTFAGGLVAALMAVTLSPVVPPASAGPAQEYAQDAFRATNHERVVRDRVLLRGNACLQDFAVAQASRMARLENMEHQALAPILAACDLQLVGENVAAGFPTGRSAVRQGWMRSKSHRANILDRRYRLMAIAARKGGDGRWYVSQLFGRH